jgi:hypothetical protein
MANIVLGSALLHPTYGAIHSLDRPFLRSRYKTLHKSPSRQLKCESD